MNSTRTPAPGDHVTWEYRFNGGQSTRTGVVETVSEWRENGALVVDDATGASTWVRLDRLTVVEPTAFAASFAVTFEVHGTTRADMERTFATAREYLEASINNAITDTIVLADGVTFDTRVEARDTIESL